VDGVLHLMGDRVFRMGSRPKHRTQAACQVRGRDQGIRFVVPLFFP
jgi:hypothetical protein